MKTMNYILKYILLIASALLFPLFFRLNPFTVVAEVVTKDFKFVNLLYGILIFVSLLIMVIIISRIPLFKTEQKLVDEILKDNYLVSYSNGIIAGIVEELCFRAIIQNVISQYLPFVLAIIISSVIFMLAHFQSYETIPSFIAIFLVSISLGFSYYLTGSLLAVIIAHSLFNLFMEYAIRHTPQST